MVYVAEPLNTHRRHEESATQSLEVKRHILEIQKMQALAAKRLNLSPAALAAQAAYLADVKKQLGETGASPTEELPRREG